MVNNGTLYIELKNGKNFTFTDVSEVHYDMEWKSIDVEFVDGGFAYIDLEGKVSLIFIGEGIERNEY